MANEVIKNTAKRSGVRLWECAEVMGIAESALSRKLRHELPDDEREELLRIIAAIRDQKGEK